MSYVSSLYHIIIVTQRREKTIIEEKAKDLFYFIWGIIKRRNCKLIRINGTSDHVHILLELHSTICLSDLVRDIKRGTTKWIKEKRVMPLFNGWGKEYAAFSCSFDAKESVKSYIINQQVHHRTESTENEYMRLLNENGLSYYNETTSSDNG